MRMARFGHQRNGFFARPSCFYQLFLPLFTFDELKANFIKSKALKFINKRRYLQDQWFSLRLNSTKKEESTLMIDHHCILT